MPRTPVALWASLAFRLALLVGVVSLMVFLALAWVGTPRVEALYREQSATLLSQGRAQLRESAEGVGGLGAARMDALHERQAETLRAVTGGLVDHVTQLYAYRIRDLPFELFGDDRAALKAALLEEAEHLKAESRHKTEALTAELELRGQERYQEDVRALRQRATERIEAGLETLRRDSRAHEQSFFALYRRLSWGFALVLVLAVAGTLLWALYRAVLAPIRALSDATMKLAAGDRGARVLLAHGDELGRLGAAFNAMARELERAHEAQQRTILELAEKSAEVESLNAALEDRVIDKTRQLRDTVDKLQNSNQALERALSHLQNTQHQLVHAEKMAGLGTLAGGVAHEFGNLIAGILGCVEVARRAETEVERDESLHMIGKSASRARGIVRSLLDFAKPRAPVHGQVAIKPLVDAVFRLAETEARRRGVTLGADLPEDLTLWADGDQLSGVLLNLVTNALQHSTQGEVRVQARAGDDDRVLVTIEDQGAGIAPEHLPHVFEPFFTTRAGDDLTAPGTGLGLSVSLSVIEAHGGAIGVASTLGEGTTFTITLPRRQG